MMNDYSNIPAESEFRDEMTMSADEQRDTPLGEQLDEGCADECGDTGFDDGCEPDNGWDNEPDESMDGDFDSGMASAGLGTDEDYGYYGGNEDY